VNSAAVTSSPAAGHDPVRVASHDASPLTDSPLVKSDSPAPVVSKLSAGLHSDQQFKSPRLQQLLANRTVTTAAGSLGTSGAAAVNSEDSLVPADGVESADTAEVDGAEKSNDGIDERLQAAHV